jgi:hypothetical protein
MRRTESEGPPTPREPVSDDTTPVTENGGFIHLQGAVEDDSELYFRNGEDSDGDPEDLANPNSRGYNFELEDNSDVPIDLKDDHLHITGLDQIADLQPDSEIPEDA